MLHEVHICCENKKKHTRIMKKIKIYKNSEKHGVPISNRELYAPTEMDVYDAAAALLMEGIYEFDIENESGSVLIGITSYSDLAYGALIDKDNSWEEYNGEHPEIWERYETDLEEGKVFEGEKYE